MMAGITARSAPCTGCGMPKASTANAAINSSIRLIKTGTAGQRPNQLWSWDITKLQGPVKWNFYYLYVILDVFSRYGTGWMIAYRETAALAKQLIEHSCEKQMIVPGQPDHPRRSGFFDDFGNHWPCCLRLLADLGVIKTHSRPHVSDDNPFSEAHFKTMKYRPDYPDRFGSIEDARRFCGEFFPERPPTSSLRTATVDPCDRSLRSGCQLIWQAVLDVAPSGPSRTLRPQTSATPFLARCRLDQSAGFQQGKYSLNYSELCLTLVDTLRNNTIPVKRVVRRIELMMRDI